MRYRCMLGQGANVYMFYGWLRFLEENVPKEVVKEVLANIDDNVHDGSIDDHEPMQIDPPEEKWEDLWGRG
jgi:hypothetical protein